MAEGDRLQVLLPEHDSYVGRALVQAFVTRNFKVIGLAEPEPKEPEAEAGDDAQDEGYDGASEVSSEVASVGLLSPRSPLSTADQPRSPRYSPEGKEGDAAAHDETAEALNEKGGAEAQSEEPPSLEELVELADVVVLDLVRFPLQSHEIIQLLSKASYSRLKIVIGVSSVMTWGASSLVRDSSAGGAVGVNDGLSSCANVLKEADYLSRRSSNRYRGLKRMEGELLAASLHLCNATVVATGLLFGDGEDRLARLFKHAWQCPPKGDPEAQVPLVTTQRHQEGDNVLPTVHVRDAAQFVATLAHAKHQAWQEVERFRGTAQSTVESQTLLSAKYCVAVCPGLVTQQQLVTRLVRVLGEGDAMLRRVDAFDESLLFAKAGSQLLETEVATADMQFAMQPAHSVMARLMGGQQWHCPDGLGAPGVMEAVCAEFVQARALQPLRILLHGAPMSGKSELAQRLASDLDVPLVSLHGPHSLLNMVDGPRRSLLPQGEREEAVYEQLSAALKARREFGEAAAAKKSRAGNKTGSKKKPDLKKGGGLKALETLRQPGPELSRELVNILLKLRLRMPDCRNKGFVLDGVVETAAEAALLFSPETGDLLPALDEAGGKDKKKGGKDKKVDKKDKKKGGKGGGDEQQAAKTAASAPDPSTLPGHVVVLRVGEGEAQRRQRGLGAYGAEEGRSDEDGFERRWQRWDIIHDADMEPKLDALSFLDHVTPLLVPPPPPPPTEEELAEQAERLRKEEEENKVKGGGKSAKGGKGGGGKKSPKAAAASEEEAPAVPVLSVFEAYLQVREGLGLPLETPTLPADQGEDQGEDQSSAAAGKAAAPVAALQQDAGDAAAAEPSQSLAPAQSDGEAGAEVGADAGNDAGNEAFNEAGNDADGEGGLTAVQEAAGAEEAEQQQQSGVVADEKRPLLDLRTVIDSVRMQPVDESSSEGQLLQKLSVPHRQYLLADTIPTVVRALLSVYEEQPTDPVEALAAAMRSIHAANVAKKQAYAFMKAAQPTLGMQLGEPQGDGVRISSISEESSAQQAGLLVGDVVTKIAGQPVANAEEADLVFNDFFVGDVVQIEGLRETSEASDEWAAIPFPEGQAAIDVFVVAEGETVESVRTKRELADQIDAIWKLEANRLVASSASVA